MLHKAWNSKGEMPYCFPRSSIKFQGHTVQNITDFDPNWAFPDYRPVAAFKSLRFVFFFSCDQAALQMVFSVRLSVRPSVCLSHLIHHVPIIVSSWNFQELLPWSKVMSMQKVKVRGQRSRSQRSTPNLAVSGLLLQFEFTFGNEITHTAGSSIEEVPYCFSRSFFKFQGHMALKIVEFDPDWAFPDCNSSLNTQMATKWCTKLEVALKRCPIVFQGHPSNFKVRWLQKSPNLTQIGRFRTVTPVWIHQWLQNDAQSLK